MKINKTLSLIAIPLLMGCGNSENPSQESESDTIEMAAELIEEIPEINEFAEVELLSNMTDFSVDEFVRVTSFLNNKEVTLVGYPYAYPSSEGTNVEFKNNYTQMIDGKDNTTYNVGVKIDLQDKTEKKTLVSGELFAVRGKIQVDFVQSASGPKTMFSLSEASFVANVSAAKGVLTTVGKIDVSEQMDLGDFYSVVHDHFVKIANQPSISISGKYGGTTVSETSEGTTTRVDLYNGDNKVECNIIEALDSDAATADREAGKLLKIKGKFSGFSSFNGRPAINNAMVN